MDYFEKLDQNPYTDLLWNIPERKQGIINIIGGNAQNFRAEVKVAEFLAEKYPLDKVNVVMPDALQSKLPTLPNFTFLPSTETGSFAESEEIKHVSSTGDFGLLLGDLSKNNATGKAVAGACQNAEKPLIITRDSVDLITEHNPERLLMNDRLIIMASVPQLMKLLRAVYYPKMLLMSQSMVQVSEVLHKFTLSYPVSIITLHSGQILVTQNGVVKAVPLEKSGYAPIMFWSGELAAKIAATNLYNPDNFIGATCAAIFA